MAVFNIASGQTARADEVMGNDRTAGWGENIVPRTDLGVPEADSDLQLGTITYPFANINVQRMDLNYYDSGRIDIRTTQATTSYDLNSLSESHQTAWVRGNLLDYYKNAVLVLATSGTADVGRTQIDNFRMYDASTVGSSIHVWSLYNKEEQSRAGTRLEMNLDLNQLSLYLNYSASDTAGVLKIDGAVQNSAVYARANDVLTDPLLVNRAGETVEERLSYARVFIL